MSDSELAMTGSRPYLLRALHEWIVANGMTPHLVVNAETEGAVVPVDFIQDGKIVFNISATAVRHLELGNEWVMFDARFGGKPFAVSLPIIAVAGIFAEETGQGMAFKGDEPGGPPSGSPPEPDRPTPKKKPGLRVVK